MQDAAIGILRGASILNALGANVTMAEHMAHLALFAAQREIREALRLREAHLRKFKYELLGDALTRDERSRPAHYGRLYFDEQLRGAPVPHLRQVRLETKRYDGAKLRQLRNENGCGVRKPTDRRQRVRVALPWSGRMRVVAFAVENGAFSNITLYRGDGINTKVRRDKRTENAMTHEQWDSLIRALGRKLSGKERVLQ